MGEDHPRKEQEVGAGSEPVSLTQIIDGGPMGRKLAELANKIHATLPDMERAWAPALRSLAEARSRLPADFDRSLAAKLPKPISLGRMPFDRPDPPWNTRFPVVSVVDEIRALRKEIREMTAASGAPARHSRADASPPKGGTWRLARWYNENSKAGLYPELLRAAARRRRIEAKQIGKRWYYLLESVCEAYPDYAADLQTAFALQTTKQNEAKRKTP